MDLSKLNTGDKIAGGAGIVLIISLLFFPWHDISVDFGAGSVSNSIGALESPNAFWGWLGLLLAIDVVVVTILTKLTSVKLPDLPVSWTDATFFAAVAALGVLVIKLIAETDFLGFGAWVSLILAAAMAYGAFAARSSAPAGGPPPAGGTHPAA